MTATIITIVSGKGGVGTTTAAINLSAAIAGFAKRTLVIDADIGMPNIGLMLGLDTSDANLHDLLAGTADLKEAIYDGPNNLHVLPGSISLQSFVNTDISSIREIIDGVKEKYDFIIVDSPTGINKNSLYTLSLADEVIQVLNPDIVSLAGAMKMKAIAENMGKPFRGAFLNRTGVTPNELSADRIEATLGLKMLGVIEEDNNVKNALAFKSPLVIKYPGSPASVGFNKEAADIAGIMLSPQAQKEEEEKARKKKARKFSLSKDKK